MWSNAWKLARSDLAKMWLPAIITIIFMMFNGLILGYFILGGLEGEQEHSVYFQNFMIDFLMLTLMLNMGFIYTKDYLQYYRNDIFTRKLSFYSMLPIRKSVIVAARVLVLLLSLLLLSVFFYGVLFWVSDGLGAGLSLVEYAQVVGLWTGITIGFSGVFILMELGYSGKRYMAVSVLICAGYAALCVGLGFTKVHLLGASIDAVRSWGAAAPAVSLAAGTAAMYGWAKLTVRRLHRRDFH